MVYITCQKGPASDIIPMGSPCEMSILFSCVMYGMGIRFAQEKDLLDISEVRCGAKAPSRCQNERFCKSSGKIRSDAVVPPRRDIS